MRGGGQALREAMDTVSEVKEIKHAYRAGFAPAGCGLLSMETHPAIRPVGFIVYKFLNSSFWAVSGRRFRLCTPHLSPSIFSAGGIGLALGTVTGRNTVSSYSGAQMVFSLVFAG